MTLRKTTELITGAWKLTDMRVNGNAPLKKVDQELWLWYTSHGPAWYISDQYVQDGGSWQGIQCLARVADRNGSPSGEIFIPHSSSTPAQWVFSSGVVFVPHMAHSLLQRFEALQSHVQQLMKTNEELKQENLQLQLELQQLGQKCGQAHAMSFFVNKNMFHQHVLHFSNAVKCIYTYIYIYLNI